MRDAVGAAAYEWDEVGRLKSVRRRGGVGISYAYDALGRLTTYSLGGANTVEYEYDFMGRVAAMKTPAGPITYQYQTGDGRVVRTLPNGVRTVWESEPSGKLRAITHSDTKFVIAKFSYDYRPDGLIGRIVEWSPRGEKTLTCEYDTVQRLVGYTDSTGKKWQAEYDPLGNRTKAVINGSQVVEARYDWAGRLTAFAGETCTHDASGNLIRGRFNGGQRQFEYDHDNRVQRVNQGEVAYEYDGDGFMVARTVGGKRTTFIPDTTTDIWRPLQATTPQGKQRFYVWEGRTPLATVEDGQVTFILQDQLGSARCLVDQAGKVIERRDYSAYGECSTLTNKLEFSPGFAGLFWDGSVSAYLTRARIYGPELGRFLQTDPQHRVPMGAQADLSVYAYCGGDPVNWFLATFSGCIEKVC